MTQTGVDSFVICTPCHIIPERSSKPKTKKPKYCAEHKKEGMVNVKGKRCEHEDCLKFPHFGNSGERPKYCVEHKKEGMVNVTGKRCEDEDCLKFPYFGNSGERPKYCVEHKKEGMVNVKSKTCEDEDCTKQPNFGNSGESPKYCVEHKKEGMVNVKSKRCEDEDCTKYPVYGNIWMIPKYCVEHKKEGMVNVKGKRCEHEDCTKQPAFGNSGERPQFCVEHKKEGMYDVISKRCVSKHCETIATQKYDGYCAYCFINLFPNDERVKMARIKSREILVECFLEEEFGGFRHDTPIIYGGCDCLSRRRIDHRKLINATMLAIETDEGQHKSYDDEDETNRYDDLYMHHSGKFIFIRFNPDSYRDQTGKRHPGFFDNSMKQNTTEVERRLSVLKDKIDEITRRIEQDENTELVEIHKLFYDELP